MIIFCILYILLIEKILEGQWCGQFYTTQTREKFLAPIPRPLVCRDGLGTGLNYLSAISLVQELLQQPMLVIVLSLESGWKLELTYVKELV